MTLTPYFSAGGVTLYPGDCREIAPTLGRDFAVVSDPPYGVKAKTDSRRFSGGKRAASRGEGVNRPRVHGDDKPFDPAPWLEYPQVLLWGGNHFSQRLPQGTWLVWIKKPASRYGTFLSDAEIAWINANKGVYVMEHRWEGVVRASESRQHYHPTQKPIAVMEWCFDRLQPRYPILDPYAGSGSTLLAARKRGLRAVGIEIDERYCEVIANRITSSLLEGLP